MTYTDDTILCLDTERKLQEHLEYLGMESEKEENKHHLKKKR